MKEKILKEIEELRKTRIAVYAEGVEIKTENPDKDKHEIILDKCSSIIYDNLLIDDYDEIILENRKLTFMMYDDYNCYNRTTLEIDLSKGYIEIYKGFENQYIFIYKEFKDDQTVDKDHPLNLDKYPRLSYSIEESKIRKDYYEIIITIRMSPLDEFDYKLRAFYPMSSDFTGALGIVDYYRNKIINGEFAEFFGHKNIKFKTSNAILKEDSVYNILDYHCDEFYFTIQEQGEKNPDSKINIPFIDILDNIEYLDMVD